jgi:hypothetical protein
MLHQNDPALKKRPSIATHGCYFRAIGALCEMQASKSLTAQQIIEMYDWCIDHDAIVDERGRQAFIMRPDVVGQAAQHYLGMPQTFRAVYRRSIAGYDNRDFLTHDQPTAWLAMGSIKGAAIMHFWVTDQLRNEIWDPLSPSREKLEIASVRGFVL